MSTSRRQGFKDDAFVLVIKRELFESFWGKKAQKAEWHATKCQKK